MSWHRMTNRIKIWSLLKVLTKTWWLENNQADKLTFRKYQKRISVTKINDAVSSSTLFNSSDIAKLFFSFVKVSPVQAASLILRKTGLFLLVACLHKRIPELPKTCNKKIILLYWKIFAMSLRSRDQDLYLNLPLTH